MAKRLSVLGELNRIIFAYGPCPDFDGPKGCDVCSARHAPLTALKTLRSKLRRRSPNRASTRAKT